MTIFCEAPPGCFLRDLRGAGTILDLLKREAVDDPKGGEESQRPDGRETRGGRTGRMLPVTWIVTAARGIAVADSAHSTACVLDLSSMPTATRFLASSRSTEVTQGSSRRPAAILVHAL